MMNCDSPDDVRLWVCGQNCTGRRVPAPDPLAQNTCLLCEPHSTVGPVVRTRECYKPRLIDQEVCDGIEEESLEWGKGRIKWKTYWRPEKGENKDSVWNNLVYGSFKVQPEEEA